MRKKMAKAAKKTAKKDVNAPKKAKAAGANKGTETSLIRRVTMRAANKNINTFKSGDTVNVYVKVKEGEKERVQVYKGIVTKIQGSGIMKSFTVRKMSAGVGVERTFPFVSPALDRVEIVAHGQVRRSKLYYLRDLKGKAATVTSELATAKDQAVAE
jgi:large subunit ribosomal protein L19